MDYTGTAAHFENVPRGRKRTTRPSGGWGSVSRADKRYILFKESAESCVPPVASCQTATAAPSGRPCPSSPETGGSTARVIATSYAGRAAIRETPDARRSNQSSAPRLSPSCASISRIGKRFSSEPSPPLQPASDPAAQSVFSGAKACDRFLRASYRSFSQAPTARSKFPSCAEVLAIRATRLRLSIRTAATISPPWHPVWCTPRAAKSPACAPATFCKSLPPAQNKQFPPAPRCTPPSARENPARPDGAAHWG